VHAAIKPHPNKVIKQVSSSLDLHLSAWKDASLPSLWLPPCPGRIKGNFDVAVRDSFAVAAAVVSDSSGSVILAATLKLVGSDVLQGEATAALLASRLAVSTGVGSFDLEGDALLVLLAINSPAIFASWNFASIVSYISLELSSF
jgi:hypothetical protein